ncbi:negative elongation factor d [Anaeramoeba flamelloides]|uniref:Negative elongation factor d n=1 Tax=Anaeramoeba flamelloides TaxID=1746091 RepID=A0AAV7YJY6_9EUKA|nr:negative elongation factor d [Anaeramoeba flamelloides]KAJ6234861.1 negative elongation factor d [Anaeramoeba flamelloides]
MSLGSELEKRAKQIQLTEHLSSKDYILETEVMRTIQEYLQTGGKPLDVITMLSTNYKGYAEMVNLISYLYIYVFEMEPEDVTKMIIQHLFQLIIQQFDPQKVDTLFKQSTSAPVWLSNMIKSPEWQPLINDLHKMYPDCLILNYAIQKISQLNQKEDELITNISGKETFENFNVAITNLIGKLIDLNQENEYEDQKKEKETELKRKKIFKTLLELSCKTQYNFLYTIVLLNNVMERSSKSLKRIIQEMINTIEERYQSVVWKMYIQTSEISKYSKVCQPVYNMLRKQNTSAGDIRKLYLEYLNDNLINRPPIEIIRIPQLIEYLIEDIFNPQKRVTQVVNERISLLALIVHNSEIENIDRMSSTELKREIESTISAIRTMKRVCANEVLIISDLENRYKEIKKTIKIPVISVAILKWIEMSLTKTAYNSPKNIMIIQLELIKEIIYSHKQLQDRTLNVLQKWLLIKIDYTILLALEMKKLVIELLVELMKISKVMEVMKIFQDSRLDRALIRHFVIKIIEFLEPPFSKSFFEIFSSFLTKTTTIRSVVNTPALGDVIIFLKNCSNSSFITKEQAKVLNEIQKKMLK